MLWLLELPKRIRLGWHEWWMDTHHHCSDSAREDMWLFLDLGDHIEADRLGRLSADESKRAAKHATKVIDLLEGVS